MVKFTACQCIYINVSNDDGNFPQLPTDPDKVVGRLRKFMLENEIFPNIRGGSGGPTHLSAFFAEDDANKIIEFLKSIGVEGNT